MVPKKKKTNETDLAYKGIHSLSFHRRLIFSPRAHSRYLITSEFAVRTVTLKYLSANAGDVFNHLPLAGLIASSARKQLWTISDSIITLDYLRVLK